MLFHTATGFLLSIIISYYCLSNLLFAGSDLSVASRSKQVTFLHFNDFYDIDAHYDRGGLLLLSQLITEQKNLYPNAIVTFGGDLLSPSFYSAVTKGKHMIDALNLLQVDIAVPGNHEFDFGLNNAIYQFSNAKFPWIITNLHHANGSLLEPTIEFYTQEVNGLKIGYLGLISPEFTYLSRYKSEVKLSDFIDKAKQAVLILKKQDVDLIVALTHLTLDEDKQLAQKVTAIDLILGGHDHFPVSLLIGNTLILKSGSNAEYLGVVNIAVDKSKSRYAVKDSWQLISTASKSESSKNNQRVQSNKISSYLKLYSQQQNKDKNKHIVKTKIKLNALAQTVRSKESSFSNLLTDALKHHYKTDIALINGGAIRSNKIYEPDSIVTKKDILSALPFSNKAVIVQLTGKQLLEILEHGVAKVETYSGRFPQVSGMQFDFSPQLAAGKRVSNVKIANKSVVADKVYTMATIDYLFEGGDGYESFKQTKAIIDVEQAKLFTNIVIDYLSSLKQITSIPTGRIKRVNKN
jgi:5'-nucleotidase/UDP-sugar diphosphatase